MSRPHPFADLEEAPRAGVDPKRIERRSKTLRAMVWVTVSLAPIALLGWITALGSSGSVSEGAATSSPGRLAATEAVRVWLTSDASPLPGGEIISWNGATEVSSELDDQSGVTVTVESNSFTVGLRRQATTTTTTEPSEKDTPSDDSEDDPDAGGETTTTTTEPEFDVTDSRGAVWVSTYDVAVLVAVDSRGGTEVISSPSLSPIAPPVDDSWVPDGLEWPGLDSATASDSVDAAVQRWAEVYVLGSGEDLALATGDPDEDHRYLPLDLRSQPDAVTANVRAAASDGENMVVRVSLTFAWPAPDPDVDDEPVESPPIDMDLLVERSDTASPVVVAWGSPGSGPELVPYANGYVGDRTTTTTSTTTSTTTTQPGED